MGQADDVRDYGVVDLPVHVGALDVRELIVLELGSPIHLELG